MDVDYAPSFGRYLRKNRRQPLRQFCRQHGVDHSNWSKYEQGKLAPPLNRPALTGMAEALGIKPHTRSWKRFMALAYATAKKMAVIKAVDRVDRAFQWTRK